MESTRPGKNLGKYDRLALAECIDLVVRGARTIFYNGINRVKIQCEDKEDANTGSLQKLIRGGFKLFITASLMGKKAFTGLIDSKYSAEDIVCRFCELLNDSLSTCSWAADGSRDPAAVYAEFLALTTGTLERCGAYRPSSLPGKREVQPLWWNPECDDAIARRRDALKRYTARQTREERVRCRRIDGEVKRFLKRQKHLSFVFVRENGPEASGIPHGKKQVGTSH